ncbi:MAG: hypothetical protein MUE71_09290 [Chitinophagaceae bacterium]|nr:hypothetical protein [Chitinophagaceae bacterium]
MLFTATIGKSQNVGIGTNNPQFSLDVVGRMRIQAGTVNNEFTSSGIWLTDYRNNSNLVFAGMADSVNYGLWSNRAGIGWQFFFDARYGNLGLGRKPSSGSGRMALDHADGAAINFYTNGDYNGYIRGVDGSLNIAGASSSSICFPVPCTPPPAGNLNFWPVSPCLNPPCIDLFSPGRTGFYTNDPKSRIHMVAGTNTSGVLIGSISEEPAVGYMLAVGGKIICEEVRVQLSESWPDYVFEPDYQRPTLNDLERMVKTKKHLPGIPSAAVMEAEKGITLGEFQTKLLQKLEELYLYVFDLNNENKELKKQIEHLSDQIKKNQ